MPILPRIDAHQHFWRYHPAEYGWIDDSMQALRRDFLADDLAALAAAAGIDRVVSVQARQSLAETEWLLQLAAAHPLIAGVVGWAPLAADDFTHELDRLASDRKLKGLRHVVQAEPDGFLLDAAFNRGISLLPARGLVYDLLILERQLPEAVAFVDRHPGQIFVLDHIAKPRIAAGELEPWAGNLRELARRENVFCKLSGMVTEADWHHWRPATLQPYIDVVLEAFGPSRLLAGSDWPVCTVAAGYAGWFETLDELLGPLSAHERGSILGSNAARVYRLTIDE